MKLLLMLLFTLAWNTASLSPPYYEPYRPDYQTSKSFIYSQDKVALLSGGTSPMGSGSGYRNQTFVVTFTTTAISTTNRIQAALGIVKNYFDYSSSMFTWDVSISSLNYTGMYIHVYVNGSNKVTDLQLYYVISTNLYFDIGYFSQAFTSTDDVVSGNNQFACEKDYKIIADTTDDTPLYCCKTNVTVPYPTMTFNASLVKTRIFLTGLTAIKGLSSNFGFQITSPSRNSTYFTIYAYTFQQTQVYMVNGYFMAFEPTTIKTPDKTTLVYEGVVYKDCYLVNSTGCISPPDDILIKDVGQVFTPNLFIMGISKLYTPASGTGNFGLNAYANNGTTINVTINFTGNAGDDYKVAFNYVIYQKISCTPHAINIYLTSSGSKCNNTCNGGIGQYPDANNWCQPCGPLCYTCVSTSTQCTSCFDSQFRVLNGSSCDCNPFGYYDDTSLICPTCDPTCVSCTSDTNASCTACNLTAYFRVLQNNSCICIDGYYDSGANLCSTCHYSCTTCTGGGFDSCLSCNSSWNRYLSGSKCLCAVQYYESGVSVCSPCDYTCLTCSGGSNTQCMTCLSTSHRIFSSNSCLCNTGYYEIGPTTMICGTCFSTCMTCNGPLNTNCLSCYSWQNRGLVISTCKCNTHYYEANNLCYPCDYSCENCTGPTNAQCSSCLSADFRTLFGTSCPCNLGYFDNGISGCLVCHYSCQSCITNSTNCLVCNSSNFRIQAGNTCPCANGYIDSNMQALCDSCHYSCTTCYLNTSSGCSSCDVTIRYLTASQCLCLSHTYDNGFNVTCSSCHYSCLNCSGSGPTDCTSCQSTDQRGLTGTSCPCVTSFYDIGVAMCQPCNYPCENCSSSAGNCTSCSAASHRTIIGNTCPCIAHYYENNVHVCPICLSTCLNCTGYSICTACDSTTNHRTLSGSFCVCLDGYFDTGSVICPSCSYSCLTCITSLSNCLTCNTSALRTFNSGSCPCNAGFYDSGSVMCTPCQYSCDTCLGGLATQCTSCNSTALRSLNGSSCVCTAGYYDNGALELCLPCLYKCLNCSSATVCTACNSAWKRTISLGDCVCNTGYYDANTTICSSCHSSCLTCNNGTLNDCITCDPFKFRNLSGTVCVCQNGYYETMTLTCLPCSYTCLSCSNSKTNCTSCAPATFRTFNNNSCNCNSGYFDSGALVCSPCSSECMTCVNSATNCLSCNSSQLTVLKGNLCVCQAIAYFNSTFGVCELCNMYCYTCINGSSNGCTSCSSSNKRYLSGTTCLCISGYFQSGLSLCGTCHSSCLTCLGESKYNCTSCSTGLIMFTSMCIAPVSCSNYYFDGQCVNTCPNISYPSSNTCLRCTNNCYTCFNATRCLSCLNGYYFMLANGTCQKACPKFYYADSRNHCYPCPNACQSCLFSSNEVICTSCNTTYLFYNNTCVSSCPANALKINNMCIVCVLACATCFGISSQQCLTCLPGYFLHGTGCVSPCPELMFNSSLQTCQACPINCTSCKQGNIVNTSYCTSCVSPLYPSNGVCISQGYFWQSGSIITCHSNCETCTNSSFSSCIKCKPLRGNGNQLAIKGYCDCVQGTIDIGSGRCDNQLYDKITSANTIYLTSTISVCLLSLSTGLLTSNLLFFERFVGYNQQLGQFFYLNASVPASMDKVLSSIDKFNIGNLINTQSSTTRRLLYQNSTQTLKSLFLHNNSTYLIQQTCLYILVLTTFSWLLIGVLLWLQKLFKKKYIKTEKPIYKTCGKICSLFLKYLRNSFLILLLQLTTTQVTFSSIASFTIGTVDNSQQTIISIALACILTLYYLSFLIYLTIKAVKAQSINEKDPNKKLFSQFQQTRFQWYRRIHLPLYLFKCILLQIFMSALSFSPLAQCVSSLTVQILFTLYCIAAPPYPPMLSRSMLLHQIIFSAQIGILTGMIVTNQSSRLSYSLAFLAMNFVQVILFGVIGIIGIWAALKDICLNKKKVAPNPEENEPTVKEDQINKPTQINDSQLNLKEPQLEKQPVTIPPKRTDPVESNFENTDFNFANNELQNLEIDKQTHLEIQQNVIFPYSTGYEHTEQDLCSVVEVEETKVQEPRVRRKYRVESRRRVFQG